jgi:hypothetical protein
MLLLGFPFIMPINALGFIFMFIGSAEIALNGLFVVVSPPLSDILFAVGVLTFLFGLA